MLLSSSASWVGQSYAGKPQHLRRMVTQAMNTTAPALGIYFKEERPTLDDALDEVCNRAGAKPRHKLAVK